MNTMLLELCAAVAGIVYLMLAFRESALCWIFYLLSAVLYIPVLVAAQTIVYAVMQIFFIAAALYGLFRWKSQSAAALMVHRGTIGLHLAVIFGSLLTSLFLAYLLRDSSSFLIALADALISVFSLAATFLTVWKVYENWHYWLAINALGVMLYLERGYQMTAVFFLANFLLSFEGLRSWRAGLTDAEQPPSAQPDDRSKPTLQIRSRTR